MKRIIPVVLLVGGFLTSLGAQDMNFSQFHNSPFILNPGLTGVFNGSVRTLAMYRNQWRRVPADFNTFAVGYDMRHHPKKCDRKFFFSHGLIFYHDQAGDVNYRHTSIQALGSYTQQLGKRFFGTVGVKMGPAFEGFNSNDLNSANQFDPSSGLPDLSRPIGEANSLRTDNQTVFDLSAGINMRYQILDNAAVIDSNSHRTRIDFGIGFFHINQPDVAFLGEGNEHNLSLRFSPYAMYVQQLGSKEAISQGRGWDLLLAWRTQFQVSARETSFTLGGRYYLASRQPGSTSIMPTLTFRVASGTIESVVPGLELTVGGFNFGASYDLTTSPFRTASERDGAFMIFLSYIFKKVKIPCKKACPII